MELFVNRRLRSDSARTGWFYRRLFKRSYFTSAKLRYLTWGSVALGTAVILGGAYLEGTRQMKQLAAPTTANLDLVVELQGVRNGDGVITATLCLETDRFPSDCQRQQSTKALAGTTRLLFTDVPAGQYAVAAFHDEDEDGQIAMHMARKVPREGVAFSNDAIGAFGPPSFDDAKFDLSDRTVKNITMRYLN